MTVHLQQLIGVDKKNPYFTICRDTANLGNLNVFFGAALMEVVPEDKSNPEFKLLIARLFNARVNAKSINEQFGIARTTMNRWGNALKSGEPERLLAALSGQGAPRKLTPEIQSFIKVRFPQVYEKTHYNYSAIIRKEIKEIFGKDISSESLRPIFKELKKIDSVSVKNDGAEEKENLYGPENMVQKEELEKQSNKCDTEDLFELPDTCVNTKPHEEQKPSESSIGQEECNGQDIADNEGTKTDNRKNSLVFHSEYIAFCYHVGALIFSNEINEFDECINSELSKQFLLTVLLGAKNIEQTKILDFNAVKAMLGSATSNRYFQRTNLSEMSTEDNVRELLKYNAKLVNANQYTDFYYDPHVKNYTGAEKILKGWCAAIRSASKVVNMDFIHIAPTGHPVYVETIDNFYDMRERFIKETKEFRNILECDDEILTFIVDRGIYSFKVFEDIVTDELMHIVTWEKGYKRDKWDEQKISGNFSFYKERNNSRDLFKYDFEYIDQDWGKNDKIRQLIVRATNPKGNTIEVALLADDSTRKAEEIIELMFSRWVQENDFKYSEKHFGINEITSYSKISYKELKGLIEDKQTKRGEYKAFEREAQIIRKILKNALYKERTIKSEKRRKELKNEINELTKKLEKVNEKKSVTEKEGSKIEELIEKGYSRLNTNNKKYMDCIKIIARNIFYKALDPFKEKYDNYRDDHVIFRNLTQAHGVISFSNTTVDVTIFPTAHLQPKTQKIIEEVFHQINSKGAKLTDGSGRNVFLKLGKKIDNALFEIEASKFN
jgi:hypothetical protein